jgi:hypothetical protein
MSMRNFHIIPPLVSTYLMVPLVLNKPSEESIIIRGNYRMTMPWRVLRLVLMAQASEIFCILFSTPKPMYNLS